LNIFQPPITSVLVIEHGRLPTTDYYVRAHVRNFGVPVRFLDSTTQAPSSQLLTPGTMVIFVRYVRPDWQTAVLKHLKQLHGVACFLDDDLLDRSAWNSLPWSYRWKLLRYSPKTSWLTKIGAAIWVSTPYLQEKYQRFSPELLVPKPSALLNENRQSTRLFYHGTTSHQDDFLWLELIVRMVQERCPETTFEVFGDHKVNKIFRSIPRVSVLHPMSWENYLDYAKSHPQDIGLVPRLANRFNLARSTTKFFDVSRCNAVGIYSDVPPFTGFIQDGEDGLLLPNEPTHWVDAITDLVNHPQRRAAMAAKAKLRAEVLSLADD